MLKRLITWLKKNFPKRYNIDSLLAFHIEFPHKEELTYYVQNENETEIQDMFQVTSQQVKDLVAKFLESNDSRILIGFGDKRSFVEFHKGNDNQSGKCIWTRIDSPVCWLEDEKQIGTETMLEILKMYWGENKGS